MKRRRTKEKYQTQGHFLSEIEFYRCGIPIKDSPEERIPQEKLIILSTKADCGKRTPEEIEMEDLAEIMAMTRQTIIPLPKKTRYKKMHDSENPEYQEDNRDFSNLGLHITRDPRRIYGRSLELDY